MLSFSNEVDPFFSATHIYFSNTNLVLFFWLWGGGGGGGGGGWGEINM